MLLKTWCRSSQNIYCYYQETKLLLVCVPGDNWWALDSCWHISTVFRFIIKCQVFHSTEIKDNSLKVKMKFQVEATIECYLLKLLTFTSKYQKLNFDDLYSYMHTNTPFGKGSCYAVQAGLELMISCLSFLGSSTGPYCGQKVLLQLESITIHFTSSCA